MFALKVDFVLVFELEPAVVLLLDVSFVAMIIIDYLASRTAFG